MNEVRIRDLFPDVSEDSISFAFTSMNHFIQTFAREDSSILNPNEIEQTNNHESQEDLKLVILKKLYRTESLLPKDFQHQLTSMMEPKLPVTKLSSVATECIKSRTILHKIISHLEGFSFGGLHSTDRRKLAKKMAECLPDDLKFHLVMETYVENKDLKLKLDHLKNEREKLKEEKDKVQKNIDELRSSRFSDSLNIPQLESLILFYHYDLTKNEIESQKLQTKFSQYQRIHQDFLGDTLNMICHICMHHRRTHVLPCGHFFCVWCLNHLPNQWDSNRLHYIKRCPDCMQNFTLDQKIKIFF